MKDLLDWLNQESPDDDGRNSQASRQRVLDLRDAIETVRNHEAATEEIRKAEEKVKAAVIRYPPVSEVEIRAASGNAKLLWRYRKIGTTGIPYGERQAVSWLFDLAKTSDFEKIRKCDCGRWFFAKRAGSVGCCPKHQRKAYEKTPEYKAYKADYMRKRYAKLFKAD